MLWYNLEPLCLTLQQIWSLAVTDAFLVFKQTKIFRCSFSLLREFMCSRADTRLWHKIKPEKWLGCFEEKEAKQCKGTRAQQCVCGSVWWRGDIDRGGLYLLQFCQQQKFINRWARIWRRRPRWGSNQWIKWWRRLWWKTWDLCTLDVHVCCNVSLLDNYRFLGCLWTLSSAFNIERDLVASFSEIWAMIWVIALKCFSKTEKISTFYFHFEICKMGAWTYCWGSNISLLPY